MIARNVINTVTRRPHLAETNAIVRAFARAVFGPEKYPR
jgi:hypothetical protein